MARRAGERLGPYEILAPIGASGMGEVYKARDTRLSREVALEGSSQRFSERVERETVHCTTSGQTTWSWSWSKDPH